MQIAIAAAIIIIICLLVYRKTTRPSNAKTEEAYNLNLVSKPELTLQQRIDAAFQERRELITDAGFELSKHLEVNAGSAIITFTVDKEKEYIIADLTPIPFKSLLSVEMITSEYQTTNSGKSGGVGRAVVGGVLAGGAGAVVGAMTAKDTGTTSSNTVYRGIRIYVSDIDNPVVEIATFGYKDFALEVYGTINAIIAQEQQKK